jgi:purine-nucleoside phosphorylase
MNKEKIQEAVDYIVSQTDIKPRVGVILGSGLGEFAGQAENAVSLPYAEIPHFYAPTVTGHSGRLVLGTMGQAPVAILQGRIHLYEGHLPDTVVLPVRTLAKLGVQIVILTNAAGGINPDFKSGDLMIIRDHLNLQGTNPLLGPNDDELGPRFPDMSDTYKPALCDLIEKIAGEEGISIRNGVYAGMLGPTYETPAEIKMLWTLGADAVGMSTVAEATAAHHMGVDVCGISLITNMAAGLSVTKLSHEEVKETAERSKEYFIRLLKRVIGEI